MPSLKLEEFDLILVLKDTIHLFGDEESEILFKSDAEKVLVESDNSQIRRMFINLIRNSIQAKASIININLSIENGFSIINISDDGIGISSENQNKIFETNFTTKEKGLGLGLKLIKRFLENTEKVYDLYGPTETTTYSTFTHRLPDGPCTIGRPLANTQIYILDGHLQPVPVGVPGELFIGGKGLARGYLNRPELTAGKFIPNPFSKEPGARLYKTGDLARYLPDGSIEFLGRIDHQVKVRGFRIELGEIESVLRQHPAIKDVIVVPGSDNLGDKRLIAYIVLSHVPAISTSELRGFVSQKLPDYMVPSADTEIKVFPKSQNRVALFYLGGIEYQLCESMQPDGRFAKWIGERGDEGLHHICYEVDDIEQALAHAQAQGASLRICQACQKYGSHPHPEGWVAFLDNEAGGIEIEFMQVYTPEQLEQYRQFQGI